MSIDISQNEIYIYKLCGAESGHIPSKKFPWHRPRTSDGFVLIQKGSCRYDFDDGSHFVAKAGELLYLARDAVYLMEVDCEQYEFLVVNFDFEPTEKRISAVFPLGNASEVENLFSRLLRRYSVRDNGRVSECMSLLYRIYEGILRGVKSAYLPGSVKYMVEQARGRILRDYAASSLTVAALAVEMGVSEVRFRKLFHDSFGTSPARYIIGVRIARAKELIRSEYLTLDEIAEQTGFSSQSYFCRVFRAETGMTPGQFRLM